MGNDNTTTPQVKLVKKDDKPTPKYTSDEMTEPWSPSSLLHHKAVDGQRLRWCDKANMSRKVSEGWSIVEEDGKEQTKTIEDGTQTDTTVQMRELILMKMPEGMAVSRNKHWQKLAGDNVKSVTKKFVNDVKAEGRTEEGPGGRAYGSVTVSEIEKEGDNG